MDNFKRIINEEFKIAVIGDVLIGTLPSALACLLLIVSSLFYTYETNLTTSMYPVIEEGSGLIGVRTFDELERGDIISFSYEDGGYDWVKRILGLPGETVEFKDNKIYIDGVYYEDPYTYDGEMIFDQKTVLDNDEYFVVGDNRAVSKDSRYIGPIKKDAVQSKIIKIFNIAKSLGIGKSDAEGDGWNEHITPSDLQSFE